MKSDIHVCSDWRDAHDRPVYTLGDECPECGAQAVNSAPAPFSPEDPNGEYRRRAKRRRGLLPAAEDDG
ncbi:RNA-protein complex protein Nop10 [Haloglomus salinum]|uniref:RNA-protein complex protein Nop10 n=1 Tax=Haloglomus salinum TaxID=2962673 RepID=UPI0020C94604|nr:RNA-protein complex protein Nop10 [Haloglomus salinum]